MKNDSLFKEELAAITAFEKRSENFVIVSPILENPHPVVAATTQALSSKPQEGGICFIREEEPFISINVSTRLLDRVLRICDALFKALEKRGVEIVTQSEKGIPMNAAFKLKGVIVPFYVDEPIKVYPYQPVSKEEWQVPRNHWPKQRYLRGGLLRIKTYQDSLQGAFVERKQKPLESELNHIITTIFRQAYKSHDVARNRQKSEARTQKVEARLKRFQKYLRRKEKWCEELKEMIAARNRAIQIRQLLQGMEQAGVSKDPEWMAWAKAQADEIDPLIKK